MGVITRNHKTKHRNEGGGQGVEKRNPISLFQKHNTKQCILTSPEWTRLAVPSLPTGSHPLHAVCKARLSRNPVQGQVSTLFSRSPWFLNTPSSGHTWILNILLDKLAITRKCLSIWCTIFNHYQGPSLFLTSYTYLNIR